MAEYYRKEEVLKAINDIMTDSTILHKFRSLRLRINRIPAADVVEVKHGEWENNGDFYCCSECINYTSYDYDYCPYCGAKMDGRRDVPDTNGGDIKV